MLLAEIEKEAKGILKLVWGLNVKCADLNNALATVPKDAPFPLDRFAGKKVSLHNVRYNLDKRGVVASVKICFVSHKGDVINGLCSKN